MSGIPDVDLSGLLSLAIIAVRSLRKRVSNLSKELGGMTMVRALGRCVSALQSRWGRSSMIAGTVRK
jgi:hypothetical protein